MNSSKGQLVIISGPSGAGKSTVLAQVMQQVEKPFFSVSATTRTPRPGEVDGVNYYFISKERFLDMISEDALLEYAEYVGNYYGTPLQPIRDHVAAGYTVFLDVEVQGYRQIRKKVPEALSIFIAPPSLAVLAERLRSRGTESEEKILGRLQTAEAELKLAPTYDYIVVNDAVDRAAGEVLEILRAGKE